MGRNKKASFNYIKEQVWKKIQGWKEKLLSQVGREIIIKVVVQVIPTYRMSCFNLPVGLCTEIKSLVRKFQWGQNGDRRKVHWVKCEILCQAKTEGGMGFKDLALFNDALLAKHGNFYTTRNPYSLRFLNSNFFPNCSILEALDSSVGSYAWQSILKGRDMSLERC